MLTMLITRSGPASYSHWGMYPARGAVALIQLEDLGLDPRHDEYVTRFYVDGTTYYSRIRRDPRDDRKMLDARMRNDHDLLRSLDLDPDSLQNANDAVAWCTFCKRRHPGGAVCLGHHP